MITAKEYTARRRELMSTMQGNSIAIVAAAAEKVRSRDTLYPYKQATNLSYLCGFSEPESVLVLIPGRDQGESICFVAKKISSVKPGTAIELAQRVRLRTIAVDDAFPIGDLDDILPGLLEGKERVYYAIGKDADFDRHLMSWVNGIGGSSAPGEFVDLDHIVNEMRLIKTASELKLMRQAGEISARAHCRAMGSAKPGIYEYQLQAEIEHEFMASGATAPAYTSIVGGGKNGCILHYIENREKINNGDLVLIDAGCEYENYAADITRTFPINGKFSREQAAIYDIVLRRRFRRWRKLFPALPTMLPMRQPLR